MPAEDAMLFVDANKFLDLYRTDTGKKLLAPLGEQVDYIFVSQQVVNEVQRNKIQVVTDYLVGKFKNLKLHTFNVPDHLAGTKTGQSSEILQQMSEIDKKIKNVNKEVDALALGIVQQTSRSEDEVSKALAPIFAKAVPHSQEELQRARDRRELGNPPGKSVSPIGDQLNWEQILTRFKKKRRLWIISRDGDYGTVFDGKGFLNRFLYDELCNVASNPEAYLFADLVEGINHFVDTTGVKAERRLTPEEIKEVEEEEKALPQLAQPSESIQRMAAEMARLGRLPEGIQQMAADVARFSRLPEGIQQTAAEMARFSRLPEGIKQMAADVAKLGRLPEGIHQMAADVARFSRLPEGIQQMAADMARLGRLPEGIQQMAANMARADAPASAHEPPKGLQEEKCQQRSLSAPSPHQKGDDEEKKEKGLRTDKNEQPPPSPQKGENQVKKDEEEKE